MLESEIKKLTAAVEALNATIAAQSGNAIAAPAEAALAVEALLPAPPAAYTPILATVPIAAPAVTVPAPAPEPAPTPTVQTSAPAGQVGKKEITEAAIAVGRKKNSAVLRAILAEFGASSVSGIKPEQYAVAFQKLQAALAD